LEEARQAHSTAASKRGTPREAFEIGRAEALTEVLHSWSNRLRTFELERDLRSILPEIREFLAEHGY